MITRRNLLCSAASLLAGNRLLRGDDNPKFSSDVKVVNVLATVRDKQGRIVRDLTKDDFTLEEDNRPQPIRYFSQQSGLPLTLGLLVDTSGSQRRVLGEERRASYTFLEQVLREEDLAFVIHFNSEVELLQDITSSRKLLEEALGQLEMPQPRLQRGGRPQGGGGYPGGGGRNRMAGTTLYDAVMLASDELMRKQSGRKALIVLSDGVDTGSKVSILEAVEKTQRADTLIYAIRFYDDEQSGMRIPVPRMGGRGGFPGGGRPQMQLPDGKRVLEKLSRETGGGYFEVSKKLSLEQIFTRVEEELRNQYNLGYSSDAKPTSSAFRRIRLATRQKNLVVQTREGYYPTQ